MVEHAADLINKFAVGVDGRTASRRLRGKEFRGQVVQFGERVHHRRNVKGQILSNKLDVRWEEGIYLEIDWRSGEAFVGTEQGVVKAGVIRRVGAHRRWDRDAALAIREEVAATMLPMPTQAKAGPQNHEQMPQVRRVMFRRADFFKSGFTDGCPACQMIISGRIPERGGNKPHTEPCRKRMEAMLQGTPEGQEKLQRYIDKSNEVIAREMERVLDEERAAKKARVAKPMDQGGAFAQGGEEQVEGQGVGGQKRAH